MLKNFFLLSSLVIILFSCKKGDNETATGQIAISTTPATNITSTSAVCGGVISNNSSLAVSSAGLCWAKTQNPTILNDHTTDATVTGIFTNNILRLLPNTTYYIRAYITTIADTMYGNQVTIVTPDMHIYIGGYELTSSKFIAKTWKDGIPTVLTNGAQDAAVYSVYAAGSDIYAAGYESNGTKKVAKLWKNGVAASLTNGSNDAQASSVVVNNGNIYVAGYESNGTKKVAKLWKNGIATNLTDGTNDAGANAVTVVNQNVYVTGYDTDPSQLTKARLWVNGVASNMAASSYSTYATSVFVSGNDVYVAGCESSSFANVWVKLWKNTQEMNIDQGNFFFGIGTGVSVFGNDVHLSGNTNDSGAAWWKNGLASALTTNYLSRANAIQVAGGIVYIAGTKRFYDVVNGNDLATYWVDNVATTLPHTEINSYATSIFVQ